jgi:TniQ protein
VAAAPVPGPAEALSSWLDRTARLYGLRPQTCCAIISGSAAFTLAGRGDLDLDWDPPREILAALGERTGLQLHELVPMTMAGWVPGLIDTLDPAAGQETFDTYVRQRSVLLRPGETGRNQVSRWLPWVPTQPVRLACPACAADPRRGTMLMWRLPLMASCAEHGCFLRPEPEVRFAALAGDNAPPAPQVAALDQCTFRALTTGRVSLPGGSVHAGVWFRLLRTLLDEVSTAWSAVGALSRATLTVIWQRTSAPARGGLNVWRPCERLGWPIQQAVISAAAAALHLAGTGEITARGTLGRYLARKPHRDIYEGDRRAWEMKQAAAELDAMIGQARTDPAAARQLLAMLTAGSRTVASFYRERQYLAGLVFGDSGDANVGGLIRR